MAAQRTPEAKEQTKAEQEDERARKQRERAELAQHAREAQEAASAPVSKDEQQKQDEQLELLMKTAEQVAKDEDASQGRAAYRVKPGKSVSTVRGIIHGDNQKDNNPLISSLDFVRHSRDRAKGQERLADLVIKGYCSKAA